MSRKRMLALALPLGAALAAVGGASAHNGHRPPNVQATATFSTTAIRHKESATCTAAANGDTLYFTHAVYTGTATSGDARLNGSLVVRVRSLFDAQTQSGVLVGNFRIHGVSGGAEGRLEATITAGQATGGMRAKVEHPRGRLLASWSAMFGPFTGFSTGSLDTSTPSWAKVRISHNICSIPPTQIYTEGGHHHHHHHHH
jgi:hypothetical protein